MKPWFKVWKEARNDAKLRSLSDGQHRVWFNLLCYASEQDDTDACFPYDPEDDDLLSLEVANGDIELLREAIKVLQRLRIISLADGHLCFIKFKERQYDKPSDMPEATAERKRRQREKAGITRDTDNVTPLSRDVTPIHAESRVDKNRVDKSRVDSSAREKPQKSATKKVTVADFQPDANLLEWASSEFPLVDTGTATEQWRDYHLAKGDPIKDCRASWRTWVRRSEQYDKPRTGGGTTNDSSGRVYRSPSQEQTHRAWDEIKRDAARLAAQDDHSDEPLRLGAGTASRRGFSPVAEIVELRPGGRANPSS